MLEVALGVVEQGREEKILPSLGGSKGGRVAEEIVILA